MGEKVKILIVEDTADHLCYINDLIRDRFREQVQLFNASYMDEALEILSQNPDIGFIIIDLSITKSQNKRSLGFAGLDLMKEIRNSRRRIHIIIYTIASKAEIEVNLEEWDCYYERKRHDGSSTLADKIAYLLTLNNNKNA